MNVLPRVMESVHDVEMSRHVNGQTTAGRTDRQTDGRTDRRPWNIIMPPSPVVAAQQVQNTKNITGLQLVCVCNLCDCGRNCCNAAGCCFVARCSERTASCVILLTVAAAAAAGCPTSTALDVRKNRTSTWSSHVTEISTTTSSTTSPATRNCWSGFVAQWWWWWWWHDSLYGQRRNNAAKHGRQVHFVHIHTLRHMGV